MRTFIRRASGEKITDFVELPESAGFGMRPGDQFTLPGIGTFQVDSKRFVFHEAEHRMDKLQPDLYLTVKG